MKSLIQKKSSTSISSYKTNSEQYSKDDQEIGSSTITMSRDDEQVLCNINKSSFSCFLKGIFDPIGVRMVIAEMVGTFMLMFCVCGITASTELMTGQVGLLEYAATAGLTVIVIIFSIGPVSGAHVNPAVTLAFAIFGHFPWSKVPIYIIAQMVGSVLATFIGKLIYGIRSELMTTKPLLGCASAFWVELLAAFIIMFLVASITHQAESLGHLSGFIIGIAIGLAVLITGPVSGGSLNPARSLGPAIVSWNFEDMWVYITAPIIGSVVGALTSHFLKLPQSSCSPAATSHNSSLLGSSLPFAAN